MFDKHCLLHALTARLQGTAQHLHELLWMTNCLKRPYMQGDGDEAEDDDEVLDFRTILVLVLALLEAPDRRCFLDALPARLQGNCLVTGCTSCTFRWVCLTCPRTSMPHAARFARRARRFDMMIVKMRNMRERF